MIEKKTSGHKVDLASQLLVRNDGFSLQASLERDPRFWIRVEIPHDRALSITDLDPGTMSDRFCIDTLIQVFSRFAPPKFVELRDVYPSWENDPVHLVELQRRVTRNRKVIGPAIEAVFSESFSSELSMSRNKYNLLFFLGKPEDLSKNT